MFWATTRLINGIINNGKYLGKRMSSNMGYSRGKIWNGVAEFSMLLALEKEAKESAQE